MHEMESTPKVLTTIGLALEGLSLVFMTIGIAIVSVVLGNDMVYLSSEGLTASEIAFFEQILMIMRVVLILSLAITTIIFVINLTLFSRLMRGKYSEETASKVYTYQLVWGVICLFFNQLVGIAYLVSALLKDSKKKKTIPREGF